MAGSDDLYRAERDIERLILRYAERIDARQADDVAGCFTASARLSFNDGAISVVGHDQILATYRRALGVGPGANGKATTHLTSPVLIEVAGDTARAVVKVVAFLLRYDQVVVRGLHFDDQIEATEQGWRFSERRHKVDWQSVMSAVDVSLPAFKSP